MNIELVRCLLYSAAGYLSGGVMYASCRAISFC